jgi:hypothetical protein
MKYINVDWVVIAIIVLLILCLFLVADQRDTLKEEAVQHGYAEWVVDTKGETTWQWKKTNQKN